ncbi:hypothetical protein [Arabiibacter massiliensis]|uniref:hypothetical protein n=1 Tax=Arabiibacter massiliensis TaxID=1870985 RepID=UPI0009BB4895|nr:hypothetical protein [Arabiibacter massiliensis]
MAGIGGPAPAEGAAGRLSLDRDEALRYLGYSGQIVDGELLARFEELARACELELNPAYVHAAFPVDAARTRWDEGDPDPQVALAGCGLVLPGRDIARHLRGACEVALMACTLGAASERELRKHAAVSPADALMYGAAASALAEAAAEACDAAIAREARERGLFAGSRYSPGYGDLPLSVQPAFLAALDATRRIGLSVTEGDVLVLTKSVTAVIGLFDDPRPAQGAGADAQCAACPLEGRCGFKEKGRTCHG